MVGARLPIRKDLKVKINGIILFSPAIREHRKINKIPSFLTTCGIFLARSFSILGCKRLPLPSSPLTDSSKNLNLVDDFAKDNLRYHGNSRPGSIINCLDSLTEVRVSMRKFTSPLLLVQGGKDKKVNPLGAFDFFENINS